MQLEFRCNTCLICLMLFEDFLEDATFLFQQSFPIIFHDKISITSHMNQCKMRQLKLDLPRVHKAQSIPDAQQIKDLCRKSCFFTMYSIDFYQPVASLSNKLKCKKNLGGCT